MEKYEFAADEIRTLSVKYRNLLELLDFALRISGLLRTMDAAPHTRLRFPGMGSFLFTLFVFLRKKQPPFVEATKGDCFKTATDRPIGIYLDCFLFPRGLLAVLVLRFFGTGFTHQYLAQVFLSGEKDFRCVCCY